MVDDTTERRIRIRFRLVALIYGLATANFVALTQFAPSIPHGGLRYIIQNPDPPFSLSLVSSLCGSLALLMMAASVPILVSYALLHDIALHADRVVLDGRPISFAAMLLIGLAGLGFAIAAYYLPAGILFGLAVFASLVVVTYTLPTPKNENDKAKEKDSA